MADRTVFVDGTTSGTPGTNGAHYASLSAAITGEVGAAPNLVSGAAILHIECSGSSADTTAVDVTGFTTDATHYVHIYTATGSRHSGVWSTGKYRLEVANPAIAVMRIRQEYTRIEGLQVRKTASNGVDQMLIEVGGMAASTVYISECIVRNIPTDVFRASGIWLNDADITLYVWNCIIYGFPDVVSIYDAAVMIELGTAHVYSTTAIGGFYGVEVAIGATATCKNVYAAETSTDGSALAFNAGGTLNMTNCASSDTSASGTGAVTNVAVNTTNFTNVTASSEDFHIPTGSALRDVGTNTSGESAPLNFTTDIDGQTRTGTWDIGADSFETLANLLLASRTVLDYIEM